VPDGTPCDDNNACTEGDACVRAACRSGQPLVCTDDDPCTAAQCDTAVGCIYPVVIENRECGSCTDRIDNDGDGNVDFEDPKCATLALFQRYAVIGTATEGSRSVTLGVKVAVLNLLGIPGERAGVCGVDERASIGVRISGTLASDRMTSFSGGQPPVNIGLEFLNTNGLGFVRTGFFLPLVGPPTVCSGGTVRCLRNEDCPAGQSCTQQMEILNPANPFVNTDGTAPDMIRCLDAIENVPIISETIAAYRPTRAVGTIRLRANGTFEIQLGPGQEIVDIEAIRVGRAGRIVISGTDTTVAVLRVKGSFKLGTESQIVLTGGLTPDRVVWNIQGAGGVVKLGSETVMQGTFIAALRPKISIGVFSSATGALMGERVRLGREVLVDHVPFTPLLEGELLPPRNLVIDKATLRADRSRERDNGRVKLKLVLDDEGVGTFTANLLANRIRLRVTDGGFFDASIALTGCSGSDRVFRCLGDSTRATIKRSRIDPLLFTLDIRTRGLSSEETGPVQPLIPVTVALDQGGVIRADRTDECRRRGSASLVCKRP
jgi:hypothetical protein